MEKNMADILVEPEDFKEAGDRVLTGMERVFDILNQMEQCGYGVKGSWQGESGVLCGERIQGIIGESKKALREIREYVREVQEIAEKGSKEAAPVLPDLPGDFLE